MYKKAHETNIKSPKNEDGLALDSYSQDTLQDTPQVTTIITPQIRLLIENISGEMSREELQGKMEIKDREYFRRFYLKGAIVAGLIEMTLPGKPNSKNQCYRLTNKGKMILSQLH